MPGADPHADSYDDAHGDPLADADYRQAVVDLVGVLAYGELTAFHRLADDARHAPTIADKAALSAMAVAEFGHFQRLHARLEQLGADPEDAMRPFVAALDGFHDQTSPKNWFESLVKAYVGDGIASDFYRAMADFLDPDTRGLVIDVLADTGHAEFAVDRLRQAIEADPALGGRLALWGRRLLGEALAQAQRVVAERETLSPLFMGGSGGLPGADLVELARIFNALTEAHTKRMATLGLAA